MSFAVAVGRPGDGLKPPGPNEETIAAIKAVERGEVKTFNTLDELFEDLHSDADD